MSEQAYSRHGGLKADPLAIESYGWCSKVVDPGGSSRGIAIEEEHAVLLKDLREALPPVF